MLLKEMKEYYLSFVKATLSEGTYNCYLSHLNSLFKFLDKNNIINDVQITSKVLLQYIYEMHNNNVSNATINKRFKPLKKMFEFCQIENNCLNDLKLLKEKQNHFNSLNTTELNNLVNYLNTSDKLILKNKYLPKYTN